jgi:preprotein translocase subunit SecG
MITGIVIAIHVIICALLIVIILIQAGRGGGLVENLSSMESVFGPKTNKFLTRTTTILAILFFITCIGLALISAQQSRSLMRSVRPQPPLPASPLTEEEPLAPAVTPAPAAAPTPAPSTTAPASTQQGSSAPQPEQKVPDAPKAQ